MKKLLSLLLILLSIFSLAACDFNLDDLMSLIPGQGEEKPNDDDVDFWMPGDDEEEDKTENTTPEKPVYPWTDYNTITIEKAIELCGESGNITTDRYYIKATVQTVTNAQYGAMVISDETGTIDVYGTYSADGSVGYAEMTDKPRKGDEVLLHCILQNYNGTKEIKNARLIDFKKNETVFDPAEYKSATIAEAREAAVGDKVSVSGVVARITYAFGLKPNGFILVDNTSSIYVYDGDCAQQVAIGNTVTIAGEKDLWILDTEQSNAQTFGYKGSCQISSANLVSNDGKVTDFDKRWITESTVKDMIDTPVTENVTSKIYKVTAVVNKVPGTGFTNYYFNDLDYIDAENPGTGTYTYTQCNGSDFGWLDSYDGKICTVYITALNAKSTASSCYFRFLPIYAEEISDFSLTDEQIAAHAVKYYGAEQFLDRYTGDPALELITSVSSSFLGFEGVTLSYSSSNTDSVYFSEENGKTVMHCNADGVAAVTITAVYNGKTVTGEVSVKVGATADVESITVKEAIESADGTTVTVKGVIASNLINQTGFFLIDETGAIGVRVSAEALAELKTGYEIVVTGTRTVTKEGGGQICIDEATVVKNNYGKNSYSTASFITGKTIADISAIADSPAETAKIYVVTGRVTLTETAYYSQVHITDGTTKILLYTSSASQYSWLTKYAGQDLTLEVNTCDWNAKGLKGYVISATLADGTKIVNELIP